MTLSPPLAVLLCEKSPIRSSAVGAVNCELFDCVSWYPSHASQKNVRFLPLYTLGIRTGPPKLAPNVRFGCSGSAIPAALLKKLLAAQLVWRIPPKRLP